VTRPCGRDKANAPKEDEIPVAKPETNIRLTRAEAEALLSRWLAGPVRCTRIERLAGGMINSVLRLDFDREPHSAVIKLGASGERTFTYETRALEYLRKHTSLPCPAVYIEDSSAAEFPFAFLLLEILPGVSLPWAPLGRADRDRIDRELAAVLLELHSHKRDTFGGISDDRGKEKWADVFLPRLHEVRRQVEGRLPAKVLGDVDRALSVAGDVMGDESSPSLIHGDIWATNIMVAPRDDGWHLSGLIDPGAQYADIEMELAYIEVFATAGRAFFETYTAQTPLRAGYALRRLFYWLHTYLIHVHIFGDQHYKDMTARVAAAIARSI